MCGSRRSLGRSRCPELTLALTLAAPGSHLGLGFVCYFLVFGSAK